MTDTYNLVRGHSPLIVSMPHCGEELGPFAETMTAAGLEIADTDWHLPWLYDFLPDLGATMISARYSRYVIDLNRDPSGKSLYPGQNVTELCPTTTFAEEAVYQDGHLPVATDVRARTEAYWRPYHDALAAEIGRVKAQHGYAILWDAHSIRSHVPRFFEGRLPDFNLGTNAGASCDPELAGLVFETAQAASRYQTVLNGRFKGGYITRHYGSPADGVHAIQLELAQVAYMIEAFPFHYQPEQAAKVAAPIRAMLEAALNWRPAAAMPVRTSA